MDKQKVDPTTLPDVYRRIYDLLGEDKLLLLWDAFKGEEINFPIHLNDRDKVKPKIIESYNGSNLDALAKQYGFTKRWARQVIKLAKNNS
ncbi:MAG: hypothetical protein LKG79_07675 [Furfurilactobacillus sp.]|jgi:Mor family transcriptional regulator|uniref:Mor transcription activator domain-containing protein n=2 Tax=Furfurilactobacillus TaxID=2767882 RepID=A0A0R1R7X6_9LACO|nr:MULTISPECIES: Mor transcription activator family protein [Furfurilactobacillus]KRL53341.1 hypothetical protein FD35_GL001336 [Furfurilactobacillus rossiae DSM 15814]MCF6166158.1 hypothetical protein [Furfurilactobacillus rossiae]MCF6419990.1 hypothetical protein [Furfurilactobacillus milii]MCH4012160.1 hypothetical protein [Furfurilactobacillus sp.]MCH4038052.1 hypothetical protein [Furfurilactobacillus sp.]